MDKETLRQWLEERYSAIRIIRERVYNFTIWTLWILLTLSWAIIQIDKNFWIIEKVFFSIIPILSFIVIYFFYLKDLEKWFNFQREIAWKIEKELWFYDNKKFIFFKKEWIYPETWEKPIEWNFFRNSYIIIWFWLLVLYINILIFIWKIQEYIYSSF